MSKIDATFIVCVLSMVGVAFSVLNAAFMVVLGFHRVNIGQLAMPVTILCLSAAASITIGTTIAIFGITTAIFDTTTAISGKTLLTALLRFVFSLITVCLVGAQFFFSWKDYTFVVYIMMGVQVFYFFAELANLALSIMS